MSDFRSLPRWQQIGVFVLAAVFVPFSAWILFELGAAYILWMLGLLPLVPIYLVRERLEKAHLYGRTAEVRRLRVYYTLAIFAMVLVMLFVIKYGLVTPRYGGGPHSPNADVD